MTWEGACPAQNLCTREGRPLLCSCGFHSWVWCEDGDVCVGTALRLSLPLGRPERTAFVFSESDHEHHPDGQDGYIICSVWYKMKMWVLPLESRISRW